VEAAKREDQSESQSLSLRYRDSQNDRFWNEGQGRWHDRSRPKSGHRSEIAACRRSATSCREQSQQGSPYSIALVGARLQQGQHLDANYLRSLEIDDQFVLGRCLDGQIGRLFALEGAIDVAVCAPILVEDIRPAGDQAAL
jgi:hypothetical protein